jgi:hypothetical protein
MQRPARVLTREPSDTDAALAILRKHVTDAIGLLIRGRAAEKPDLALDANRLVAGCDSMTAAGLGRYLCDLAPSQVLVSGYEAMWQDIWKLQAENAKLRAAMMARGPLQDPQVQHDKATS